MAGSLAMSRAQAPKKVDVAALMKKADTLLDEVPPQLDRAIPLLREVVATEPGHLLGLHSLSWCLDPTRRLEPHRWERELKAEHWRLRDRILELTRGTKPGGALTLAHRARSLALSQWAEDLVRRKPTVAQLDEVEAALDEADSMRPLPDHQRGRRGLEAWRALTQGKKEQGYRELLAKVEEVPGMCAQGVTGDDDPLNFQGLEGAFSDEGFHAWLRKQKPAARPKGKQAKDLDAGLLLAAGLDAKPFFGPGFEGNSRTGRVLALVALGADVEVKDSSKHSVLHLAAMVDDAALVKELLRLGVAADVVDSKKSTPLHVAAEYGGVSCIAPLAKGGVPVDALDASGRTALFEARQADVAQALIEAGANPNAGKGWTPLHQHARFKERGPVIEVLLKAGAEVSLKNGSGQTPVQEALEHQNASLAQLMGAKASPGKAGALDVQPLLEALKRQRKALLKAWYFEDKDVDGVDQVLQGLALQGATSWDQLAASLQGGLPWTAMAVVQLARDVLPAEEKTPRLSKLPRFVRGDLVVKGDVHVDGPLLVTGDLTVEGVVRNAGMEGMLVVGGTLRATGVDTDGEVVVGKDLEARVVWGHGNDASLRVGGVLKADVVIADDHDIQAKVKAKHHYENGEFDASDAALKKLFVAKAFARSELDRDKLFNVLRKDGAVQV
ncbi:ankyrin repeat domain-containing protein [Myxococcus sp. AM009]|uniref:ankyrin repeat domain-containing protein n=1 Tax=unclassified Myxococcus TaxID=2648731 RepID=UPI001594FC11|nr:ankyrin repeat domain-containing protein [Myxococcus sp. AM009]NVI97258.1 ankyrin repeat domain-containing protein [Myxococcus sp. AM009]NVJ13554.1 ankyrin repeat domain-containing protein [Myxococcus sp. AM010]